MPNDHKISRENGQLSIDFIIGFTIFMLAFIFVATMASGLLVDLQSRTIDYDAVAYRTGVILVEDPGEFELEREPFYWQLLNLENLEERNDLKRLGLAIDRNTPGIIQRYKIEEFFSPATSGCTGNNLCYPSDYSKYLIFGDYPYTFNISLKELNGTHSQAWHVGELAPDKYGYIRRIVSIKNPGYTEINVTNSGSKTLRLFIYLNELNSPAKNPAYQMNPYEENITIFLKNVTIPGTQLIYLELLEEGDIFGYPENFPSKSPTVRVNGDIFSVVSPVLIDNNTKIVIEEGYFYSNDINENGMVELRMTFSENVSDEFPLNIEESSIVPPLTRGIMEIKIW
ncbi:MAG: DUF7287 family protein [Methanolinea sp.]